jgi:hypothetical protein
LQHSTLQDRGFVLQSISHPFGFQLKQISPEQLGSIAQPHTLQDRLFNLALVHAQALKAN